MKKEIIHVNSRLNVVVLLYLTVFMILTDESGTDGRMLISPANNMTLSYFPDLAYAFTISTIRYPEL